MNKIIFTQEQIDEIKNRYKNYEAIKRIANSFNCSRTVIIRLLKEENVFEKRTSLMGCLLKLPNEEFTDIEKQVLEGCLLGDGCISLGKLAKTPTYIHTSINKEYIDHLKTIYSSFPNIRIHSKEARIITIVDKLVSCKKQYSLQTTAHRGFNKIYDRWYPENKKIVPRDIQLTPTTVKYWFYDDGYTSKKNPKYRTIVLGLCTHGFTWNECEFLLSKLEHIGKFYISNERGKPVIKTTRINVVQNFFDYIGQCDLECFKYKWKIPENK